MTAANRIIIARRPGPRSRMSKTSESERKTYESHQPHHPHSAAKANPPVRAMIGFSNPKAQYLAHREEILAAIAAVLDGGRYVLGDGVRAFEADFARYCGVAHAVGLGNGTDDLPP